MIEEREFFRRTFAALANVEEPYDWQTEAFLRLSNGRVPPECGVPTGLGKTSILQIWVLSLAWQALQGPGITIPRRLVYIVNRRTVVDQATTVAEAIAESLAKPSTSEIKQIAAALSTLATASTGTNGDSPIAVSTLRGQLADNEEWKQDPARPAIIIGTVDMVGSKLLFSGYGDGRWKRSFHAGLLGQDVLYVHDEAHLSPAFGSLLVTIAELQKQAGKAVKPFVVIQMTATPTQASDDSIGITATDQKVLTRLHADKRLTLRLPKLKGETGRIERTLAEHACRLGEDVRSVLVYVETPEVASRVAAEIRKKVGSDCVRVLTGTIRGYERDQLTNHPVFRRFLSRSSIASVGPTCYLISTSAGEVGVDLDADAGVFDMTTIDRFIQRAGRVNRSGGRVAHIDLLFDEKVAKSERQEPNDENEGAERADEKKNENDTENKNEDDEDGSESKGQKKEDKSTRLSSTLALLKKLPLQNGYFQASPAALSALVSASDYKKACEPSPRIRPIQSYLLDTWSLTGLSRSAGHLVAPWLHGLTKEELPDTWLAWRSDIPPHTHLGRWLEIYPLRTRELARINVRAAEKFFKDLAEEHQQVAKRGEQPHPSPFTAVLVASDGSVGEVSLDEPGTWSSRLAYATIVLPSAAGGLVDGLPDSKQVETPVLDVSDEQGVRERWRLSLGDAGWQAFSLTGPAEQPAHSFDTETFADATAKLETITGLSLQLVISNKDEQSDEGQREGIVYLGQRRPRLPDDRDVASTSYKKQTLTEHLSRVGHAARQLEKALDLNRVLDDALGLAGQLHDLGKNRPWWQMAVGNSGSEVYAKYPGSQANWAVNGGYRHEFGSLLEITRGQQPLEHGLRDLVLHLVAAHHGFARPGFPNRAYDIRFSLTENEQAEREVQLRFDRLQREWGWWALAYLEALLKAADVMGS